MPCTFEKVAKYKDKGKVWESQRTRPNQNHARSNCVFTLPPGSPLTACAALIGFTVSEKWQPIGVGQYIKPGGKSQDFAILLEANLFSFLHGLALPSLLPNNCPLK